MRHIKSNGSRLTVREVGPINFVMMPKVNSSVLPIIDEYMDDEKAKATLGALRETGLYSSEAIKA